MGFPPSLLNDDEAIVLDMRPHWWYVAGKTAWLVAAVVAALVLYAVFDSDWAIYVGVTLIVIAAFLAGWRYLQWVTKEFVVTTDRVIYRHGIFVKHGIQIPLDRVNNVIFRQNLRERLLGAGSLLIESASAFGQQQFSFIRQPEIVQRTIFQEMEDNENRKFDRVNVRGSSVAEQLDKLDELRQRGVISEDEFQREKARLVDPS